MADNCRTVVGDRGSGVGQFVPVAVGTGLGEVVGVTVIGVRLPGRLAHEPRPRLMITARVIIQRRFTHSPFGTTGLFRPRLGEEPISVQDPWRDGENTPGAKNQYDKLTDLPPQDSKPEFFRLKSSEILPWLHDEFNGSAHLVVDVHVDKFRDEDNIVAIIDKRAFRQRDGFNRLVYRASTESLHLSPLVFADYSCNRTGNSRGPRFP